MRLTKKKEKNLSVGFFLFFFLQLGPVHTALPPGERGVETIGVADVSSIRNIRRGLNIYSRNWGPHWIERGAIGTLNLLSAALAPVFPIRRQFQFPMQFEQWDPPIQWAMWPCGAHDFPPWTSGWPPRLGSHSSAAEEGLLTSGACMEGEYSSSRRRRSLSAKYSARLSSNSFRSCRALAVSHPSRSSLTTSAFCSTTCIVLSATLRSASCKYCCSFSRSMGTSILRRNSPHISLCASRCWYLWQSRITGCYQVTKGVRPMRCFNFGQRALAGPRTCWPG